MAREEFAWHEDYDWSKSCNRGGGLAVDRPRDQRMVLCGVHQLGRACCADLRPERSRSHVRCVVQRIAGDVDLYSHQYDRPSCDPYQTRSACAVWEMLSDQLRLLHPCASAYVAALVASAKLKERRHTYYANTLYYNL